MAAAAILHRDAKLERRTATHSGKTARRSGGGK
jgi:hypothetical protein